ncbi:MAG: conjugal transfer protein TraN [Pseudomonadota bacterium]
MVSDLLIRVMAIRIAVGFLIAGVIDSAQASEFAKQRQTEAIGAFKSASAQDVPGFTTDTPPETGLNNYAALESATAQAFNANAGAQFIKQSAATRPYFALDAAKDPIVLNSAEALADPEAFIAKGEYTNRVDPVYEDRFCEESKPDTIYSCHKNLIEPTIHIQPAKYSNWWCTSGAHGPDDPRCQAKRYYSPARKYQDEVITITKEEWSSTCGTLEEHARRGICKLMEKTCPRGPETREIIASLGDEGKSVARNIAKDCWQYKFEYRCCYPAKNNCTPLRRASCEQMQSTCIKKIAQYCVVWRQQFRCFKKGGGHRVNQGANKGRKCKTSQQTFTMPDVAAHMNYKPNAEMNEAMAKLSVFQEIQDDLRANGDGNMPQIFKGSKRVCRRACAGFSDCCKKGKGWGHSIGLAGCNGEEQDLAQRRGKGLCVQVGTFKDKKVAGVTLRKKTSFCCFPSKLSRIIHQQGRPQLGRGWGAAKTPDCGGFSVDELSHLDFSRLDLREIYADIVARMQQPTVSTVKRNLGDQVQQMTSAWKQPQKEAY